MIVLTKHCYPKISNNTSDLKSAANMCRCWRHSNHYELIYLKIRWQQWWFRCNGSLKRYATSACSIFEEACPLQHFVCNAHSVANEVRI